MLLTVSLPDYADMAVKEYGHEVLENRAIPELTDGLKPVHRYALMALYDRGATSKALYIKAAKPVSGVIGDYHPHGDTSAYDAMANITGSVYTNNCPQPLIDGKGNWGNKVTDDPPAHYRYTNCRLNAFSEKVFFDPRYLAVANKMRNFDDSRDAYVTLPALLPNLLLNGAAGIAVGCTSLIPSFELKGIVACIDEYLKTGVLEPKTLMDNLVFNYPFRGGKTAKVDDIKQRANLIQLYKTGVASIYFESPYTIKGRDILIMDLVPGFKLPYTTEKLKDEEFVNDIIYQGSATSDSCSVIIELKKTVPLKQIEEVAAAIVSKYMSTTMHYKTNVLIKSVSEDGEISETFKAMSIIDIIKGWCAYRVKLEIKALVHQESILTDKVYKTKLLIFAAKNRDTIVLSLKQKDPYSWLAKELEISIEDATTILKLQVIQLSKLDENKQQNILKEQESSLGEVLTWKKKPKSKTLLETTNLMKSLVG